jgi:hypothetical protein
VVLCSRWSSSNRNRCCKSRSAEPRPPLLLPCALAAARASFLARMEATFASTRERSLKGQAVGGSGVLGVKLLGCSVESSSQKLQPARGGGGCAGACAGCTISCLSEAKRSIEIVHYEGSQLLLQLFSSASTCFIFKTFNCSLQLARVLYLKHVTFLNGKHVPVAENQLK